MIVSTVCGVLAIVMFILASRGDIGLRSTVTGGIGLAFVLAAIMSTPPTEAGAECVRFSRFASDC